MAKEVGGMPGVTPEIFREFVTNMMRYYVEDSREVIVETFKKADRFLAYDIPDMGILFEIEVTDDGDCLLHWEPTGKSRLKFIADSLVFDDMMTRRQSAMEIFLRRRASIEGPVKQAFRIMGVMSHIQRAYVRSRGEIVEKYGLDELDRDYPVPEDFERRAE